MKKLTKCLASSLLVGCGYLGYDGYQATLNRGIIDACHTHGTILNNGNLWAYGYIVKDDNKLIFNDNFNKKPILLASGVTSCISHYNQLFYAKNGKLYTVGQNIWVNGQEINVTVPIDITPDTPPQTLAGSLDRVLAGPLGQKKHNKAQLTYSGDFNIFNISEGEYIIKNSTTSQTLQNVTDLFVAPKSILIKKSDRVWIINSNNDNIQDPFNDVKIYEYLIDKYIKRNIW